MADWDAIPWKQTRYDGVRVHFYASDKATGRVVALIGMQPGRGYPAHRHKGPEEVLVVQGGYRDAMGEHLQGQFVRYEDGTVQVIDSPDTPGELALRPGWPSMFRGYLGEPARYAKCFAHDAGGDWYLSGDLARRDADGCYWFVGRADDLIKSAGHLIGPFEVESCLMTHPAVVEAAVIGLPDALLGESVCAYVTLHPGFEPDDATRRALLAHARTQLGAAVAPKSIEFASVLPHTRSGKVMRRLLRARELGLPEGDTSTLEGR